MEKSIEVYGNIEIKDELDEKINNPIQVEYYKICNNKKKSTEWYITCEEAVTLGMADGIIKDIDEIL